MTEHSRFSTVASVVVRPWHVRRWALLALLGLAVTPLPACERHAGESAELVSSLHRENELLRRQFIALMGENAMLRAQLTSQSVWRSSAQLRRTGGLGGVTPYTRICAQGQALAGFHGRAGTAIDALFPVCSPVDSTGLTAPDGSLAPVETELEPFGGSGGAAFDRLCDAGFHVVGLRGRAGANLDALQLVCREALLAAGGPAEDGAADSAVSETRGEPRTESLRSIGGSGGQPFERLCPDGWVAMGVSGRYGRFVDSLSLHCGPLDEPSGL